LQTVIEGRGYLNKFKVNKGSVFVDLTISCGTDRDSGKNLYQNYSCFVDLNLLKHWKEILEIENRDFGNGDEILGYYKTKNLVLTVANPYSYLKGGYLNSEGILKIARFPDIEI
jgi:hypothetical protein